MLFIIICVFTLFNIFYFLGLYKRDFSVVDIAWGPSFFLVFFVSLAAYDPVLSIRDIVIGCLVFIWAVRLSTYVFIRSKKLGQEDFRYAKWRLDWGSKVNQMAYRKIYLLQGFLSLIMASPLILIHAFKDTNMFGTVYDCVGLSLWFVGFIFEALADYQKYKFKTTIDGREKILKKGLWKYTRHPNYFGEALMWWGIFFIILSEVPFYYVLWGPLILNFFLLKVSGIPLLEQKYTNDVEFNKYKNETNAFFPWFPKGDKK